jgi:lysophospholipid acyltransferase (LPLAT)-like uncharacterized protein
VVKRNRKTFVSKSVDPIAGGQLVKLLGIVTVHGNSQTGVRAATRATVQRSKDRSDLSWRQAQMLTRAREKQIHYTG